MKKARTTVTVTGTIEMCYPIPEAEEDLDAHYDAAWKAGYALGRQDAIDEMKACLEECSKKSDA